MKKLSAFTLALALFCLSEWPVRAQEQPAQQPSAEELEKQKAEREKNAYRLLDQVIDEAQSLKLTENRVRVQINGAEMLWEPNQGRARSLFAMAAEGIAELGRTQPRSTNRGGGFQTFDNNGFAVSSVVGAQNFRFFQLRQELVLAAARHDAPLAYQLLAATKPPASIQNTVDARGPRGQFTSEDNLEQILLSTIAARDPKLAAQNAELMMEKGQFPRSLPEVINQLQRQDADAADKLADKTVKRIQSANILANSEAAVLVQALLTPGPRPAANPTDASAKTPAPRSYAVLDQSLYVDLLSTVIDAASKATPQNNQRGGPNQPRRVVAGPGVRTNLPEPLSDAQMEQTNARRLLAGLQVALPLIDQYLPAKGLTVRQKMVEMGLTNASPRLPQAANMLVDGDVTSAALVQAAAAAPPPMQSRIYQQAAFKAIEEGDTERARQIATDHLQNNARDTVMQRIDFRELAKKAEGARFEEIRQTIARLQSDNEKIDLLLQVANEAQKSNPKLATQLLDEARQITNRRATTYEHFEQQLKVAHAFAAVDPSRSFDILEPGITQLNELLAAAAVLSGFEINMFRDGEMPIQGGNGLTAMLNRYGQELAVLARSDFDRSDSLAGRFQFPEPRIITRLSIVQGLLGVKSAGSRVGFAGNTTETFVIRPD